MPKCIRGLTIVKTGGNLNSSKLKGAIAPDEILESASSDAPAFIECDPKDGFSVRNFQIQACKMAMLSDIIVYGDQKTNPDETIALAQRISKAQRRYEEKNGFPSCLFNTFMLSGTCGIQQLSQSLTHLDAFNVVQDKHPELVAINSTGSMTGKIVDFCEFLCRAYLSSYLLTERSLLGTLRDV